MTWQLIALIFTMFTLAYSMVGPMNQVTRIVLAVLLIIGGIILLVMASGTPVLAEGFGGIRPMLA